MQWAYSSVICTPAKVSLSVFTETSTPWSYRGFIGCFAYDGTVWHCTLDVGQISKSTLFSFARSTSSWSKYTWWPWPIRVTPKSIASLTVSGPWLSPAWQVIGKPYSLAFANNVPKLDRGTNPSAPARSIPTTPLPRYCLHTSTVSMFSFWFSVSMPIHIMHVRIPMRSFGYFLRALFLPSKTASVASACVRPFCVWSCGAKRISA